MWWCWFYQQSNCISWASFCLAGQTDEIVCVFVCVAVYRRYTLASIDLICLGIWTFFSSPSDQVTRRLCSFGPINCNAVSQMCGFTNISMTWRTEKGDRLHKMKKASMGTNGVNKTMNSNGTKWIRITPKQKKTTKMSTTSTTTTKNRVIDKSNKTMR